MDEPGHRADLLFDGGQKRDDVVTGRFLDFDGAIHEGAIHGEVGFLAERFHIGVGNFADAVPRLAHGHLMPDSGFPASKSCPSPGGCSVLSWVLLKESKKRRGQTPTPRHIRP